MKKLFLILTVFSLLICLCACSGGNGDSNTTTAPTTTEKTPGKYANSKYLGTWYNADSAKEELICTLNDDGTATFKGDTKASWEEAQAGITITATVDGAQTSMEGYFVIAGEGYVARATDANMHYLDEGGVLQLEIMLTENTCVDCIKK